MQNIRVLYLLSFNKQLATYLNQAIIGYYKQQIDCQHLVTYNIYMQFFKAN